MMRVAQLGFFLMAVGCGGSADECDEGAHDCDGNVASTCLRDSSGIATWTRRTCAGSCQSTPSESICALTKEVDPRCASDTFCDGKDVVFCREGFPVSRRSCASTCVSCGLDGGARCVVPAPSCSFVRKDPELGSALVCVGSNVAACSACGPFRFEEIDACSGSTTCAQPTTSDSAMCALEKSPQCPAPLRSDGGTLRVTTICSDDHTLIHCYGDRVVRLEPCERCDGARCTPLTPPG